MSNYSAPSNCCANSGAGCYLEGLPPFTHIYYRRKKTAPGSLGCFFFVKFFFSLKNSGAASAHLPCKLLFCRYEPVRISCLPAENLKWPVILNSQSGRRSPAPGSAVQVSYALSGKQQPLWRKKARQRITPSELLLSIQLLPIKCIRVMVFYLNGYCQVGSVFPDYLYL